MSILMGALPLICPICKEKGLKSTISVGMTQCTLVAPIQYYDENGNFQSSDPNTCTTNYTCSNGHMLVNTNKDPELKYVGDAPKVEIVPYDGSGSLVSDGSLTIKIEELEK